MCQYVYNESSYIFTILPAEGDSYLHIRVNDDALLYHSNCNTVTRVMNDVKYTAHKKGSCYCDIIS